MRTRYLLPLLLALATSQAACGKAEKGVNTESDENGRQSPAAKGGALTLTESGIGPINASSPATVEELQKRLPGYEVKTGYPPGLGPDNALGPPNLHVLKDGKIVFLVIPTEKQEVLSIRVISPTVLTNNGWHAGGTLDSADALASCGCTGDGLHCTGESSRVGLILKDDCLGKMMDGPSKDGRYRKLEAGDRNALAELVGQKISMLRWDSSPKSKSPPGSSGTRIPTAPLEERLAKCLEKPTPPEQAKCQAIEQARESGVLGEE